MAEPTYFSSQLAATHHPSTRDSYVDSPVAIIGGGPLGMALALMLAQRGIASRLYDARTRGAAMQDQRVLALSYGTQQILEQLGIWPAIRATPIQHIHISQQGGLGRAKLHASEQGLAALGQVCAAASISQALDQALQAPEMAALVEFCELDPVNEVHSSADLAYLHSARGTHRAQLAVYAEGRILNTDHLITSRDYQQHAIICQLTPRTAHQYLAYERFTPHGPLALLPHGTDYALVYSCPSEQSATLAALNDANFIAHLESQFAQRLQFTAASPRHIFPLSLRYRRSPIAQRRVWLGNAAQTLHPVAGQGFNLALRDAWELARTLSKAPAHADLGAANILQSYATARQLDRQSMIHFTDSLVQLFSNQQPLLHHARGLGLLALDLLPPLRHFITRRLMFGARAW